VHGEFNHQQKEYEAMVHLHNTFNQPAFGKVVVEKLPS
jgi:hypothetical protein